MATVIESEGLSTHAGQEFLYILDGEVKLQLGQHVALLSLAIPPVTTLINLASLDVLVPLQPKCYTLESYTIYPLLPYYTYSYNTLVTMISPISRVLTKVLQYC